MFSIYKVTRPEFGIVKQRATLVLVIDATTVDNAERSLNRLKEKEDARLGEDGDYFVAIGTRRVGSHISLPRIDEVGRFSFPS